MRSKFSTFLVLCLVLFGSAHGQMITTIAGGVSNIFSGDGGPATNAGVSFIHDICMDHAGNLYLADFDIQRIRIVSPSGIINTFAGSGPASYLAGAYSGDGGPATAARFNSPIGVAADAAGNIYIADQGNARVRKVDAAGIVTTFAGNGITGYTGDGGAATLAQINNPKCLYVDRNGNLYIAEKSTGRIRIVDSHGIINTFAGVGIPGFGGDGGPATMAMLNNPQQITGDALGNIYFADWGTHRVRKIDASGIINTIAGTGTLGFSGDGGPAIAARLNYPSGVGIDAIGNVYISDGLNDRVRKINTAGIINTIAGGGWSSSNGIPATVERLFWPVGIVMSGNQIIVHERDAFRTRVLYDPNHPPLFVNGHSQNLVVCQNSVADSINQLLAVLDSDVGQTNTWSLITGPVNGTVYTAFGATTIADTIVPTGLYFTPAPGYVGTDSFKVQVTDGFASDTTMIYVTVNPAPLPITGTASICSGTSTTLSSGTAGGTWTSTNTTVAAIGSASGIVSGLTAGTSLISYTGSIGCPATVTLTVDPLPGPIIAPPICIGRSTTLSNGTPGGSWTSSNTAVATVTSTGIASGVTSGTTVITYLMPAGCLVAATVSVNPSPAAITGATNVCIGLPVSLSNATAGGTWSSSNTSFAIVGSGSGIVSTLGAGTVSISYSLVTGCYATLPITIYPAPTPITGITTLCVGASTGLVNSPGIWSTGTTSVAIIGSASGIVTAVGVGSSAVTYTSLLGCPTTATLTILPPVPAITGPASVCAGLTMTLSNGTTGGIWSSSNTAVATIGSSNGVVTGLTGGTTTITYGTITSCAATTTITISPIPSAITGPSTLCVGGTSTLLNSGGIWSSGNTAVATIGSSSGVVSAAAIGTSAVTYTLPGGCATSSTVTVIPSTPAITGNTTVCTGLSATLSNTAAGGTWTSSAAAIAAIGATGILAGIAPGTATISYALGGTGCAVATTVSILSAPFISGPGTLCAGGTVTLSGSPAGGTWLSSNSSLATIGSATGIVAGIRGGIASLTYHTGSGCSAIKALTINPTAALPSSPALCVGTATTLSTVTGGGTWLSTAPGVATISGTGAIIGLSPGSSQISYTAPGGCISSTTIVVNAPPSAIVGTASICAGLSTTLSNSATGGTWTSSAPTTAAVGSSTGVVTGISAGTSIITYSSGAGCSVYVTVTVTISPLAPAITGIPNVCVGSATSLSNAVSGGTWGTGSAFASVGLTGIVSGVAAGTAVITYTPASGCSAIKVVTVNQLPSAISGTLAVCPGQSTSLGNTVSGGFWLSSSTAVANIGSATGVANGLLPGTTRITYTLGTGCKVSTVLTVSPLPPAITGPGSMCLGQSVTLSNPSAGGVWSSALAAVSTFTGVVTGATSGTAVITYTAITGCEAYKTVTVNPPPPAITVGAGVCFGTTITLSNSLGGGFWNSSNPSIASISVVGYGTGAVTGHVLGTVTITYTSLLGCYTTVPQTVLPLPPAITGGAIVCNGSSITLSNSVSGGTWTSGNPAIAVVDLLTGVVSGTAPGAAAITYTANGCSTARMVAVNRLPGPIIGADSICAWGSTKYVYDIDTPAGRWSSTLITVGSTGMITGFAPGVGTVTYTLPNGCFVTATVVTNPLPISISGPGYVCLGGTISLSSASTGGRWSDVGSASIASVGSSTGIVSGLASGIATVTYTIPVGACSVTTTVAVNPQPLGILGSNHVCVGATITMADSTSGGYWSAPAAGSSVSVGSATGIVTGISAGTAVVSYAIANLCGTATVTKTITIDPLPDAGAIIGETNLCLGAPVLISESVAGGVWSSNNSNASVSSSGLVTPVAEGSDTIKYRVTNGCGTATTAHGITIGKFPDPGTITGLENVCMGDQITLTASAPGGIWSTLDTLASVSSSGVVTASSYGATIISYTISNSCGSATVTHSMNIKTLLFPGIIIGDSVVCVGSTITVNDYAMYGGWMSDNNNSQLFPTMTGAVVKGITAGTTLISYKVANICGPSYAVSKISVIALPDAGSISGMDSVCSRDTIRLVASQPGGFWNTTNNTIISTTENGSVIGHASGWDTTHYTVTTSGCSSTVGFPVFVRPDSACIDVIKRIEGVGCSGNGEINVYPNPAVDGKFSVNLYSNLNEVGHLIVFDMLGKKLFRTDAATNSPVDIWLNVPPGTYVVLAITPHGKCVEKFTITR